MNKKCKHSWLKNGESPNFNIWSGDLMNILERWQCSKCGEIEIEKRKATRQDYIEYGERIEVNHSEDDIN